MQATAVGTLSLAFSYDKSRFFSMEASDISSTLVSIIGISIEISDIMGQIYSMFILALAAGEAALALAFITSYFRLYQTILIPADNDTL